MSQSDTNSDEQQLKIARVKGWFGLAKIVVSVLVGSVFVALINWNIQNTRLESDARKSERDFVGEFVKLGLDKDLEKRRDFAEYFYRLSPSSESRDRWKQYRDYVEELVTQSTQKEIEVVKKQFEVQLASERAAKAAAEEATSKAHAEALRLQKEAAEKADQRASLQAEFEKALQRSSEASANTGGLRNELLSSQSELATKQRELAALRSESPKEIIQISPYQWAMPLRVRKFASKEAFGDYLLKNFDRDESGVIDSPDELKRIPCSVWMSFPGVSFSELTRLNDIRVTAKVISATEPYIADDIKVGVPLRILECVNESLAPWRNLTYRG